MIFGTNLTLIVHLLTEFKAVSTKKETSSLLHYTFILLSAVFPIEVYVPMNILIVVWLQLTYGLQLLKLWFQWPNDLLACSLFYVQVLNGSSNEFMDCLHIHLNTQALERGSIVSTLKWLHASVRRELKRRTIWQSDYHVRTRYSNQICSWKCSN